MNQHVVQPAAESDGGHSAFAPDQEARNMRSLALQLRANGHMYRRWAREAEGKSNIGAAEIFHARAAQYAADALWYWRRSRREAVQFGEAS